MRFFCYNQPMENTKIITLNLYHLKKEKLLNIAKAHQLNISKNTPKKEIIETLSVILPSNFMTDTRFFLLNDLFFYASITANYFKDWYDKEKIELLQTLLHNGKYTLDHEDGQMLFEKGYLVILMGKDKKERIMMLSPLTDYFLDRIKEIIKQCLINENTTDYLTALSNIYGCFTIEQFLKIWELYGEKKDGLGHRWIKEKIVEFCNKMQNREDLYWYNGQYIIHPMIKEEELDELLEQAANKPYYIPTEKEIQIYTDNLIDKSTKAYQKMASYFKKHKNGLKPKAIRELTSRLALALKFNSKHDDFMKILNSMDYKFKNEKDRETFNEMIEFCSNNTRKWVYRGATAEELLEEQK